MSRRFTVLAACLAVSGCGIVGHGFLSPAGPIAAAERHYFLIVCLVMLFVIGPVLIMTPVIAWHYRLANTRSAYRPDWNFSWLLEGLIWIPPSAIVIGLGVLLWQYTHRLNPYRPLASATSTLEVQVVALDWKWLFIYPFQHVASVNEMVVRAGQPVHLSLTSGTVMQSLLMPRLAGQIYAMAGMKTQLNFAADRPGNYLGENTQFNGMGFQNQKFTVSARTAEGFNQWLAGVRAQPNRLDVSAYQALSVRSTLPHPLMFGDVDPGLFDRIAAQAFPNGHILNMKATPSHE
jgi:cytochrome o ubiquinol oxidase subunit 2